MVATVYCTVLLARLTTVNSEAIWNSQEIESVSQSVNQAGRQQLFENCLTMYNA